MTKHDVIQQLISTTPFPGWDADSAYFLVKDTLSPLEFSLIFPHGTQSLFQAYQTFLSEQLAAAVETELPTNLTTTDKIAWMLLKRFEHILTWKDAERAAIQGILRPSSQLMDVPGHISNLCDQIWRAAGDTSTDMNYYTKRISLGTIYGAALLYWYTTDASLGQIEVFIRHRFKDLFSITSLIKTHPLDNVKLNIQRLRDFFE